MTDIARQACVTVGKDHVANDDGVRHVLRILRERSAPDAIDAINQEVAKFLNFTRTGQTIDAYLIDFDVLREKSEAPMVMGNGFPDESVSIFLHVECAASHN